MAKIGMGRSLQQFLCLPHFPDAWAKVKPGVDATERWLLQGGPPAIGPSEITPWIEAIKWNAKVLRRVRKGWLVGSAQPPLGGMLSINGVPVLLSKLDETPKSLNCVVAGSWKPAEDLSGNQPGFDPLQVADPWARSLATKSSGAAPAASSCAEGLVVKTLRLHEDKFAEMQKQISGLSERIDQSGVAVAEEFGKLRGEVRVGLCEMDSHIETNFTTSLTQALDS